MEEVDALKVGQMFVMQYYTQMHRDAQQMVRFYVENSTIVRGGYESGPAEVITGSKAIHEKFMSLGLQQVHAKIKQMDSTVSLGNEIGPGIVIQVTGELSVSGNPMRPFVQTFVLAPESPKKYYIHNDIFRYQIYDEDLTSDVESQEPNQELEVDLNDINSSNVPDEAMYTQMQDPNLHPESPENITSNGLPEEGHGSPIMGEEPGYPMENVDIEVTPTPDNYGHAEVEEVPKAPGTSWAARISQNIPGSSMGKVVVTTTPAIPPQGPGMPQREPRQQPRRNQHQGGERSTPERKAPPMAGRGAPDSCQIFVGGLPTGTTDADLHAAFQPFGAVMEVRINPKNFGFVVFDSESAVRRVMECKEDSPIKIHSKQLNIEQKRPSGSRGGGGGGPGPRKSLPQSFTRMSRGTSKPLRRN